jgi:hypothetical protein
MRDHVRCRPIALLVTLQTTRISRIQKSLGSEIFARSNGFALAKASIEPAACPK